MNNNISNLFKEKNLNSCEKLSNFIKNNFKTVFMFSPITVAFYNEDKTLSLFLNKKTLMFHVKHEVTTILIKHSILKTFGMTYL